MATNTQTFSDLVRTQVAAIQGAAAGVVNFTVGSIELALVEAQAQVGLWLQGLILALLATTRASTSVAAALDTWMADFGFTRLQAGFAKGVATFGRFSTTAAGFVPVGALVSSTDGSQQYAVGIDTTNSAYTPALGGYVLAPGVATLNVAVLATVAGSAGNAAIGFVSQIVSAIPGIDTVTNAAAFTAGADPELDVAFRARFIAYLASLARATKAAITYAIQSIQAGVSLSLTENLSYGGVPTPGYFYAVVDDGSGAPPPSFTAAAAAAIEAVRPFTVIYGVFSPIVLTANVALSIKIDPSYVSATVIAAVQAAIQAYINTLGLGNSLRYSRIAQIAYDTSPAVLNATAVLINGATSDILATAQQTVKAGTVVASPL